MEELSWREGTLRKAQRAVLLLGIGVAALTVAIVLSHDAAGLISATYVCMMVAFAGIVVLEVVAPPYPIRAKVFVALLVLTGWFSVLTFGLAPGPLVVACISTVAAGVFIGPVALAATLTVNALGILVAGALLTADIVSPVALYQTHTLANWAQGSFEFFLTAGSLAVLIHLITLEIARQEASLAQVRRLEALGRLAGGVAHDFNNTLQVIFAWTEMLGEHDDAQVVTGSKEIQFAADRASQLTAQLLAFGKRSVWAPADIDLATHVRRWVGSMGRLLPEDVQLATNLAGSPVIQCDPGQLDQILMNLVVNARDAMDGPGRVTITVEEVRTALLPDSSFETESVARLSVRDDGKGIPPDVVGQVFEPFFSTKGRGGTGLGLSIVHSATRMAKGTVSVESDAESTTFTLCFPAVGAVSSEQAAEAEKTGALEGVVLLAEDEEAIRQTLVVSLKKAGLTLLEAEDGAAALDLIENHDGPIDVLVTDAVMPGPPTKAVIDTFRKRHPAARVLVCSGHVEDELESRDLTASDLEFLAKPFAPATLLGVLARLMEETGRP